MDEMGPLQPIPRGGRSWGLKVARRPDRYSRTRGTIQWLAAFAPHQGYALGQAYARKTGADIQDFLERVRQAFTGRHIYLIWDNLSAHKSQRQWLEDYQDQLTPVWLPTNSPWLNLIESYFSVLSRLALHNTNFESTAEISVALGKAQDYMNQNPKVYQWNYL